MKDSHRHTFALKWLVKGVSIYDLKLLIGHSSVTTNEIYSGMDLKWVKDDFPTIVSKYVCEVKFGKMDIDLMDKISIALDFNSLQRFSSVL